MWNLSKTESIGRTCSTKVSSWVVLLRWQKDICAYVLRIFEGGEGKLCMQSPHKYAKRLLEGEDTKEVLCDKYMPDIVKSTSTLDGHSDGQSPLPHDSRSRGLSAPINTKVFHTNTKNMKNYDYQ